MDFVGTRVSADAANDDDSVFWMIILGNDQYFIKMMMLIMGMILIMRMVIMGMITFSDG